MKQYTYDIIPLYLVIIFFYLFIQTASAQSVPTNPTLSVNVAGTTVSLSWSADNADTYILYAAPYPDASVIYDFDMGNQTSVSFDLPANSAYYAAIKASNSSGMSDWSNIEHFDLSTPPASDSGAGLPDLLTYSFSVQETKTIPGDSTEVASGYNCTGNINEQDQIGNLALVSLFYQNGCYTDGNFNHRDYPVEKGIITNSSGTAVYEAYTLYEPTQKAASFLASQHAVYYKFVSQADYTVYTFDASGFTKILEVPAADINAGVFTPLNSLSTSNINGSITYVFVPASQNPSQFTQLVPGVEGARVSTTGIGDVLKYQYAVSGTPFDTKTGFDFGPESFNNRYSPPRQFFPVENSNGDPGVVWQDTNDFSVYLTWLGGDLLSQTTAPLANVQSERLAAAAHDPGGNIYYLTIQDGDGAGAEIARNATFYKAGETGAQLISKSVDTSETGMNMTSFYDTITNTASLSYSKGFLGLMIGRRMHMANDGLNHQGGIAVVFNADTLDVVQNHGQTSGHSFSNLLTVNASGEFVGIDLGDNYPRGVNLHRFEASVIHSRVVYTFKTLHGTTPDNPAGVMYPEYTGISTGGTTYYQWSNDNNTYTELGGVVEGFSGYAVVFAGEAVNGKALDDTQTGDLLNTARNIGMVLAKPDFTSLSYYDPANKVLDNLILTSGQTETGGFYTFNGTWSEQQNTGVVWLTDYADPSVENASRIKTAKLADSSIIVMWEKWTANDYVTTYALKISENGQKLSPVTELGNHVRLNRRDDPFVVGNTVYLFAGSGIEKKLELIVLEID